MEQGRNKRGVKPMCFDLRLFHFKLEARPSTIPHAGLGLFLSCEPFKFKASPSPTHFSLKAVELVDLGVYAPFRIQDFRTPFSLFVKNYVYGGECEVWNLDTERAIALVGLTSCFDITADETGNPHPVAKATSIVYANESSGKSSSLFACFDPEGAIHNYLGHTHEADGPLVIKADGSWVELLIDFNSHHELVKIHKRYCCLRRDNEQYRLLKDDVSRTEHEVIKQILEAQPNDLADALAFLERVFKKRKQLDGTSSDEEWFILKRGTLVLVALDRSLQCYAEHCDSSRESRKLEKLSSAARSVFAQTKRLFGSMFTVSFIDDPIYKNLLRQVFRFGASDDEDELERDIDKQFEHLKQFQHFSPPRSSRSSSSLNPCQENQLRNTLVSCSSAA